MWFSDGFFKVQPSKVQTVWHLAGSVPKNSDVIDFFNPMADVNDLLDLADEFCSDEEADVENDEADCSDK